MAKPPYTSSPKLRTASPEISCAKPRAAIITASVTTMGWIRALAMIVPDSPPITVVSASGTTKKTIGGAPRRTNWPPRHDATAMSAPTDRSIPPVRMTSVWPTAMSAVVSAKLCSCSRMFDSVRKFGLRMDATTMRISSPAGAPKRRIAVAIELRRGSPRTAAVLILRRSLS